MTNDIFKFEHGECTVRMYMDYEGMYRIMCGTGESETTVAVLSDPKDATYVFNSAVQRLLRRWELEVQ